MKLPVRDYSKSRFYNTHGSNLGKIYVNIGEEAALVIWLLPRVTGKDTSITLK
jgi:hypothetical protein